MIQVFHVTKTYHAAPALVDITLRIDKGEFAFLAGPSGAGKTTLLKLLFRQEEPSKDRYSSRVAISRVCTRAESLGCEDKSGLFFRSLDCCRR